MRIPYRIKIKPKVYYTVLYCEVVANDPDCVGATYPDAKEIVLKLGMSKEKTMQAFVHELLHCFQYEYTDGVPHKLIYQLEPAMVYFIKQLVNLKKKGTIKT